MATFAKVWAVKTFRRVPDGSQIEVTLKSGKVKAITLEKFLYQRTTADGGEVYYYLPAKLTEADE